MNDFVKWWKYKMADHTWKMGGLWLFCDCCFKKIEKIEMIKLHFSMLFTISFSSKLKNLILILYRSNRITHKDETSRDDIKNLKKNLFLYIEGSK